MKKLNLITLIALLGIFIMQSCDKSHLEDLTTGSKLKASQTKIKIFDLDTLLFTGASATDSLTWTVSPTYNENLQARGNKAIIVFAIPGTYVITAQKPGGVPASVTLTVADNVTTAKSDTGTTTGNITSSTADSLKLVPITGNVTVGPSWYRTPAGDSVIVNFSYIVPTTGKYCASAIIQYKAVISAANSFSINLVNLRESTSCPIVTDPTGVTSANQVFKNKLLGYGTYPLTMTLNGVTYSGSLVVTAAHITINWPYTSGLVMTDTMLQ